jgi:hypothetical protein
VYLAVKMISLWRLDSHDPFPDHSSAFFGTIAADFGTIAAMFHFRMFIAFFSTGFTY